MAQNAAWVVRVHWYNAGMVNEAIRDYLGTQLPLELNAQQHFALLRNVFILVFASTIVIHLLTEQQDTLLYLFIHATVIGLVYTVGVGLATALIQSLSKAVPCVYVWHIWAASLAGFFIGYYVLPFDLLLVYLPWLGNIDHVGPFGFFRLAPIWLLVTYLIVHPYLNESQRSELAHLRGINVLLQERTADTAPLGEAVRFKSGKTGFTLDSATIRNILVDDHYCYLHYLHDQAYIKRDLAMPLRDVRTLLPADFVQVHRSHIVNLHYVVSVVRRDRRNYVVLDGGFEVPVSRHRMKEVLPVLHQQLNI